MPTSADVDSIYPVLPVWGLAQSNPILGSRPNLADTMGLSEFLQRLWFDFGKEYCPECSIELEPLDWHEAFMQDLEERDYFNDEYAYHFLVDRGLYQERFGQDATPTRSFFFESSQMRDLDPEDLYWEIVRLKGKSLSKLSSRLKEMNITKDSVYFTIKGKENLDPLPDQASLVCPKCSFQKQKQNLEPTEFSPYNAAGACEECSGHGMNLEYDREKVVKYPYLSIEEGAISLLESSHFSYLYPYLVKELKKEKISVSKPFAELPQKKLWNILENGRGQFPGLKSCYEYLESKRYKRTVRIFSRRLKSEMLCSSCEGTRVNSKTHNLKIKEIEKYSYKEVWKTNAQELFDDLSDALKKTKNEDFKRRAKPIVSLLDVALSLGLTTIPLWKKAKYLSSSEYQRSLLTKILSYEGSGSLFVLDEPSFDLSLPEQKSLFENLIKVKEQGNTILLVEHSEYLRNCSDFVIEMGPGAGPDGGKVVSSKRNTKKTSRLPSLKLPKAKITNKKKLTIKSFSYEGEDFPNFKIPVEETTVLFGSSGYRKDYFCKNFLLNTLSYQNIGDPLTLMSEVREDLISSQFEFENVLVFDSSLGKVSSRSTVGTTIGLSPEVRKYYAALPVSRELALEKGHFSPNSELGRCPTCEGRGTKEVEMSFLEDIILVCEDCSGKKLKPFIANITDGEMTAYEAFHLPMMDIIPKLKLTPKFKKLWSLVELLNLSYLSLDRPLSTLSGGERMRIKLLSQLSTKIENSFLFFDNISSGLSTPEIEKIFDFIDSLKHQGNTIFIVDQNPVLLKRAPHVISLS